MNEKDEADSSERRPSRTIGSVRIERIPELIATGIVLLACAVSPLMFVGAAVGISMDYTVLVALLPAIFVVIVIAVLAGVLRWEQLSRGLAVGVVAGPIAAVGLEVVRIIGFRLFHAMPGSMPMLMGVLLTGRSLVGPNILSDIAGWADHVLVNGASFGIVYVLIFGRPRWWLAFPYAWVIATLFMISPDMTMMGDIGIFGHAMGAGFPIVVYAAHTVFGLILGLIVAGRGRIQGTLWRRHVTVRTGV